MSIVKRNLIKTVSQRTGIEPADVEVMLNNLLQTITDEVNNGQTVILRGFGTFTKKRKGPKAVRDLFNKRAFILPARKVVQFNPSKKTFKPQPIAA